LTILCRAHCHVAHDKEYYRSRACSAAHGREGVTPSPSGRPSTPFLCRASRITHGKELCRAFPFPKAHGEVLYRVKMRRAPFAVRLGKMRTAKAVPCVFLSLPCGVGSAGVRFYLWELLLFTPDTKGAQLESFLGRDWMAATIQ
jgi:hypothetical protein